MPLLRASTAARNRSSQRNVFHEGEQLRVQLRLAESQLLFEEGLQLLPSLAAANRDHGALLHQLGRPSEAVGFYYTGIALNPQDLLGFSNLGLRLPGASVEALSAYDAYVALAPPKGSTSGRDVLNNHGSLILTYRGDLEGAMESYQAALRVDPSAALTHMNVGKVRLSRLVSATELCSASQLRRIPQMPSGRAILWPIEPRGSLPGGLCPKQQGPGVETHRNAADTA